ncbi:MAG TPA: signal peptide peptidase SppA [Rhizomicrobium sp.]|nr:signal peptide peptidase SppA [Rhizomicrobium sp.]
MVGFLHWAGSIAKGTLNAIAGIVLFLIILFIALLAIGLVRGDGLPDDMVLTADLRNPMPDSMSRSPFGFGDKPLTVMDMVLALDKAGRDSRVKGVFMRVGSGDISIPQAQELGAAIHRFRDTGKFVVVHSQGFLSAGLGDYLTAASASEIWMQPEAPFSAAGTGAGAIFLRGLFDKVQAVPQIAKRADYKSAADMFMEKDYTAPDREQMNALLQSWYDTASSGAATARKLDVKAVTAAFEASPQFSEDAKAKGLIDKIGYDDDAKNAALTRAGTKHAVNMVKYVSAMENQPEPNAHIALITASGEIVDGGSGNGLGGSTNIAGDDYANAIRTATKDPQVKAIVLRVDSPGGSVSASDQILDAVKKAQAAGKPVVVSMGAVAASGGYYISTSANKIVAEPGTITGSIGVLTGKVSFGKSLGLIGVGADEMGIGKNALMGSTISPYTDEQWANLNHQADVIYADFTRKVAAGRKLPLDKVQQIAKGRVWSGADAQSRGLVDQMGGFWTAVADAQKLAGLPKTDAVAFKRYPQPKGFFAALSSAFDGTAAGVHAMQGLAAIEDIPAARALIEAASVAQRSDLELRATNLPIH